MSEFVNSKIAAFICDFEAEKLSRLAVTNATSAILDTLAVTVAGRGEIEIKSLEASLPVYTKKIQCAT